MVRITTRREPGVVVNQHNGFSADKPGSRYLPQCNNTWSAQAACVVVEQRFSVLERLYLSAAQALSDVRPMVRAVLCPQRQDLSTTARDQENQIALIGLSPDVVSKRQQNQYVLSCGLLFTGAASVSVLFAILFSAPFLAALELFRLF